MRASPTATVPSRCSTGITMAVPRRPIKKDKLFYFGAFEQKREPGNLVVNPQLQRSELFAAQTQGFAGGPYAFR